MGVIKHHGMFITSYSKKAINKARKTAVSIFHNEIKKYPILIMPLMPLSSVR